MTEVMDRAAAGVENAWCKGNMRREKMAKEQGDAFCALGRLAEELTTVNGLALSINGEYIGTAEQVEAFDTAVIANRNREDSSPRQPVPKDGLVDAYDYVRKSPEGKAVALVILNDPDYAARTSYGSAYEQDPEKFDRWDDVIYVFNDADETTRAEVVDVFRRASVLLDEGQV